MKMTHISGFVALLSILSLSQIHAASIRVTLDANGPVGFAPLFSAFHDGSFDTFHAGSTASAGLETLAEVGDPGGLIATVAGGFTAGAVVGGPVIPSGTSASALFDVDPANSSFNYAAMLLPTNDWFIGNDTSVDVSSLFGAPVGTQLVLTIDNAWDAGTELEDFAFSAGNPLAGIPDGDAPNGTTQNGVIGAITGPDPFASFANIPSGYDTTALDFTNGPFATITLQTVPEPNTSALLGLPILLAAIRRRR